MKSAAEIYEYHKRSIRSPIFRWAVAPEGDVNTNETFAEIERAIIAAIDAAVAEERARCAAIARIYEGIDRTYSTKITEAIERGKVP